jgi:hypothetical protein
MRSLGAISSNVLGEGDRQRRDLLNGRRRATPWSCACGYGRGLDETGSRALDAKPVLVLANHIGDLEVLEEAIRIARPGPCRPVDKSPERCDYNRFPGEFCDKFITGSENSADSALSA